MKGDIIHATCGRYGVWPALASPGKWFVCTRDGGMHVGDRYFNTPEEAIAFAADREAKFSYVHERYPDRGTHITYDTVSKE